MRTLLALLALGLSAQLLWAAEGSGTRGGGDDYAIAFVQYARNLDEFFASHPSELPQAVDLVSFEKAIATTDVTSTDDVLIVNDSVKDAVNYPGLRKIELNRARWDAIPSYNEKLALVFHEYLGILRIDDTHYQVSSHLTQGVHDTLGSFVDYNRAYMNTGKIVCRDLLVENATVIIDMDLKQVRWSSSFGNDDYAMQVLDILQNPGSSKLTLNIVAAVGSKRIQIITTDAVDSSVHGSFKAVLSEHEWSSKGGSSGFSTSLDCRSGM